MEPTHPQKRQRSVWTPIMTVLAALFALLLVGPMLLNLIRPPALGSESSSRNTQVINAVERTEDVSLLSLGIQGIAERTEQRTIFGLKVPGAERALFMQYDFTAKLGMDGQAVQIRESGDNEFTISIPEFTFIGHDDVNFKVAVEKNGVLSWVTPEIDTVEMTNQILNDETQQKYLDDNEGVLREQAQAFYKGIVGAIDPDIRLEFDYISGR